MSSSVLIVGGGLAGLAAAVRLAERGFRITLIEARPRLGGRASSFPDPGSGTLLDNCQHVSMGCCTNLAHFCSTLGISHLLAPQPTLYFMTPDWRVSRFEADRLPVPFHLARSFLTAHYLTLAEKVRIAWGLARLQLTGADDDPPFHDWLLRHGQTPRTIARFWGVVLTSALNESTERVGLRYARKVFVDGFLRHRRGHTVEVPTVPLGRLYGEELHAWLNKHGVEMMLGQGVRQLHVATSTLEVQCAELRDGTMLQADWYVSAVPGDRLLALLPEEVVESAPIFSSLRKLQTSPITSVHLWYDRPVLALPHVVLVDCTGQWVFNRGANDNQQHYLQVVVSASRELRGLRHEEVQQRIVDELARLFPEARPERLVRARVITEHHATFSVVPGVDQLRPGQSSPLGNLLLAGDWTATGWPATMEGAVRSGYLAVEALLQRLGRKEQLVQPDL